MEGAGATTGAVAAEASGATAAALGVARAAFLLLVW
jgi:hypothetical protein